RLRKLRRTGPLCEGPVLLAVNGALQFRRLWIEPCLKTLKSLTLNFWIEYCMEVEKQQIPKAPQERNDENEDAVDRVGRAGICFRPDGVGSDRGHVRWQYLPAPARQHAHHGMRR